MSNKRTTQAVIIIHGIGEQRPMETLRRFVEAVLPEPEQGGEKYFSKPDRMSELFELRKLQNRSQPRTHFFEYYWAYKVEGTTFGHIRSWLFSLLFRRPSRVPNHLLPLWVLSWLLIAIAILAAILGVAEYVGNLTSRVVSAASVIILSFLQGAVIYYLGDAARYLSPHPRNIKLRHSIRADGIKLLQNIHESGDYDRVIVVGHSLGSVIAYDILKHLWQEYNRVYQKPVTSEQAALAAVEAAGESLRANSEKKLKQYQEAQMRLWQELRELGNPWLVTDLVTLGSPLAHAALLLASDSEDLKARQRQRELPKNPPVPEIDVRADGQEDRRYAFRVWEPYEGDVHLRAVHHAGHFACTRWTNLYFPARWGLFGDIIGGPLQDWFGPGIRDIAVYSNTLLRRRTLLAHTSYWLKETVPAQVIQRKQPLSLSALVETLELESELSPD